MSSTPLQGLKVLDLSKVIAGPMCAQYLGDMGAEVIKIEAIESGDDTRSMPPFATDHESRTTGTIFMSFNRNKQSVAVDMRSDAGREFILKLADRVDVVIESFGPGATKRLGIDSASLRARNPRLICCCISGFGSVGPMREGKGYDVILQAFSGMMMMTGTPGGEPVRSPFSPIDQATGLHALIGILALLNERNRTGIGGLVEASLFDTAAAFLAYPLQAFWARGTEPQRSASGHESLCPYQAFETGDKPIMLGVASDGLWRTFCRIAELDALADDPRFRTNALRVANRAETVAIVNTMLARRNRDEWLERLSAGGVPCAPIHTLSEFSDHPHTLESGMVHRSEDPRFGSLRTVAQPVRFDGLRTEMRQPPPDLGIHGRSVLKATGYSEIEISNLVAAGVVRIPADDRSELPS